MTKPLIGFCGLGAMGGGMARHLAASGFTVRGFDIYTPLVDKLVAAGGEAASSPFEAARDADYLVLMVVNSVQADGVLFGDAKVAGAVKGLKEGATIILCSTTAPAYLPELRQHLDEAGRSDVGLIDSPVSGGSIRAANGSLSLFTAGDDKALDGAQVVLEALSGPLYRVPGGIGMGSVAKMCHQHQAAVNILMASEIMSLAAVAGLDTQLVLDHLDKNKECFSWMLSNRGPHMLASDWATVHSAVTIILKDAGIVCADARGRQVPLFLANVADQSYIKAVYKGLGREDDAALVKLYLPKDQPNLVAENTGNGVTTGKQGVTIQTLVDILTAVEVASTKECMEFASKCGMDLAMLKDIVRRGAGASGGFDTHVDALEKVNWHLGGLQDGSALRQRLESALAAASSLQVAMPVATTALQCFISEI